MPEITLSSGASFSAAAGISILDAGANAQLSLPYSCRTGRCSTCKCKVIRGETAPLHTESGITDEERAEGWILSCVRTALTDVAIDIETLAGIQLPPKKTLPCRISKIERLTADVLGIELRLPPTAEFKFVPGQYVDIIGPNGIRRSYSLANPGTPGGLLKLHIRAVEGGMMSSYWFDQAKVNDLLRLHGPEGTFFLRESTDVNLVFLATGTGIAPVIAMLDAVDRLPHAQRPRSVTVIWGGRTAADLYMDIASIPGEHRFIPVLSRPADDWQGARGHVQQALLAIRPDLANTTVYACGSDTMIHSARAALIEAGLPSGKFYSDAFVCSGTTA